MGNHEAPPPPPRRKFIPLAWIGSLVAVVLLALGVGGSLSAWTASITNTTDTAGTGSLVMEEDGPGGTPVCLSNDSTATCTTINKYGGNLSMVPGQTVTGSHPQHRDRRGQHLHPRCRRLHPDSPRSPHRAPDRR